MKYAVAHAVCIVMMCVAGATAETGPNEILNSADKKYLLDLARQTVIWHLKYGVLPQPQESTLNPRLQKKLGCFVTLEHKVRGLRGCIGIFERNKPLYQNVISRAVAAAHDFRFQQNPVTPGELKDIYIEISVLTEPQNLAFASPEDLLAKLRPGVDGVILTTRFGTATFLPQVWDHFAQKEAFLGHLCEKHGAPMSTWKTEYQNIKIQTYQALVFREDTSERLVVGPKGAVVGKQGAIRLGTVGLESETPSNSKELLKSGSRLEPGVIVTWDSDLVEAN